MTLRSKPSQPDNAERSYKCSQCGNMFTIGKSQDVCDVCGKSISSDERALFASNEDY